MSQEAKVHWTIDTEAPQGATAEGALHAAKEAWDSMRHYNSTANVFEVEFPTGERFTVDLESNEVAGG